MSTDPIHRRPMRKSRSVFAVLVRPTIALGLTLLVLVNGVGQLGAAWADPGTEVTGFEPMGVKYQWPVAADVARPFEPGAENWLPGHRGVDLYAEPGAAIFAPVSGTVSFVGNIAGRGVLVISHGELRTTLEPVQTTLSAGQQVQLGEPVGLMGSGGHGCGPDPAEASATCVHWGLIRGAGEAGAEQYVDPLDLAQGPPLSISGIRLLPLDAAAQAQQRAAQRAQQQGNLGSTGEPGAAKPPQPGSVAGFVRPVAGPVTSRYGMRKHPITGVYKLHDGIDWGARCGTPIVAAADGVVVSIESSRAWGNRMIIEHGGSYRTSYNHAAGWAVRNGSAVRAGQLIGYIGSTGYSTGCHLHLQLWQGGQLINPQTVFG